MPRYVRVSLARNNLPCLIGIELSPDGSGEFDQTVSRTMPFAGWGVNASDS